MSDNILTAVLTFSLMAGGSAAIGSEMFSTRQRAEIVTLPMVTVTAQRVTQADVVTLPMVMVTGQRQPVTVAVETRASETPRVQ